jgi:hypothetical protein
MKFLITAGPTLSYGAVHARACALALRQGARRWGVYVLVVAVLASAGAGWASALAAVQALAAWLVLPLFWSVAQGPGWALGGTLAHGLAGAGLLLGARQWLWPAHWAEAERALPIAPAEQRQSDVRLIALALLPWAALSGGGAAVWLLARPPWLHGHGLVSTLALAVALGLSMLLGLCMQHLRRRAPAASARTAPSAALTARSVPAGAARQSDRAAPAAAARVNWPRAVLWWPLWRGVAPRTAKLLLAGCGLVLALAVAAAALPQWAPWWLAAQALAGLVLVSRLNLLSQLELAPQLAACAALPLSPTRLERSRRLMAVLPHVLGVVVMALAVCAAVPADQLRGGRVLGWAVCAVAAAAMDLEMKHSDDANQALRWLFMLILTLAWGSEVWR